MKTTVEWQGAEMAAVNNLCETLRDTGPPVGLEWAGMVIEHWYEKNYGKIYNARPPYRFVLKDYQAYAIRMLLLTVGLRNLIEDVIRNAIIADLDAGLQLRLHQNQLLLT